eukprot:4615902-Prorocentrum_lima.AAC.1
MTSSLVGSEMCIRDRRRRNERQRLQGCWTRASAANRIASKEHRASGPIAVSYTHLTLPTICSV